MAEDLRSWAAREGLSDDIVDVIVDQEFTTLDDVMELTTEEASELFLKTNLLKGKKFLAFKKALERLTTGQAGQDPTSPASAQSPAASWAQSADMGQARMELPTSQPRSGRGEQAGFKPLTLAHLTMDMRGNPVVPKPGHVKDIAAKFGQRAAPASPPVNAAVSKPAAVSEPRGFFGSMKDFIFGSTETGPKEVFRLLMLGKTGSGKSTTGNTIFGEKKFESQLLFSSVTTECDLQRVEKKEMIIEIMDCPGLYDTHKSQEEIATVIVQAVACMHPGPHAVLIVVRLGRFTAEEFGVFTRLKALFDDRIADFTVIVFTGGDDLEKENKTLADLMQRAPKELTQVVEEISHRCHVFNNNAKNPKQQVDKLLDEIRKMKELRGEEPYYDCPKYESIGQGLEAEVERRLAEVTKRDLEREDHVRLLKAQTEEAKAEVERLKAEIKQKETEREREENEEKERRRKEEERLQQELEAKKHEIDEEKRRQKELELSQKLKRELAEMQKKQQEEREEEIRQLEKRQREKEELEEKRRQEEREERERKERAYAEEMNRMKSAISKNEEPGWVEWAAGGVANAVAAPFKAVGGWFGW